MLAVIDGDYLPYYCAGSSKVERRYYIVSEGLHSPPLYECRYKKEAVQWCLENNFNKPDGIQQVREAINEREMYFLLDAEFEEIFKQTDAKNYKLYVGEGNNFRHDIYPMYKSDREKQSRPILLDKAKKYVREKFKAEVVKGIEADDAVAIFCSNTPNSILVSPDKDLDQVPGLHYDPMKSELYVVSQDVADFCLYTQILMGDAVDSIPGLAGIGPAKAAKLLKGATTAQEMWERCVKAYGSEDSANLTASLVYVLRNHGEFWRAPS